MRSPRVVAGILLAAAVLSGCGEGGAEPRVLVKPTTPASGVDLVLPDPGSLEDEQDVQFHVATESGEQLDLDWWTACLGLPEPGTGVSGALCADGFPPEDPASVGSPDRVHLAFDLPGWRFRQATFHAHGSDRSSGPEHRVRVQRTGERTFVVPAPPRPGDWDVDVFGRGPEGDAVTTFRWVVR